MTTITKCYTRAAATLAIAKDERRAESVAFIVSSFSVPTNKANNDRRFLHVPSRETENRKSRFAIMLSRSIKTDGETKMHINRQIGDYVIYSTVENKAPYFVRMAGDEMPISTHWSIAEAKAAVKRYQDGDKRRRVA